jgi:hypothetical protein
MVAVYVIAVGLGLLVGLLFAATPLATAYFNRRLAGLPQFRGTVRRVRLIPWKRALALHDLRLFDRDHESDGAVLHVERADLVLSWAALRDLRLGGCARIDGVDAVMIKRKTRAPGDTAEERPAMRAWQAVLQTAFRVDLTRVAIANARVRFEDRSRDRPVSLLVDQIAVQANIGADNPAQLADFPAEVDLSARVGGSGELTVMTVANPAMPLPRFYAKMELRGLSLPEIHDFLREYAFVDVHRGSFEVFSEVLGAHGYYTGYLKPFFKDLEYKTLSDPSKNLVERTAGRVAKSLFRLLKNDRGEIATKAPFEGNLTSFDVDIWTTIENLLRNAFVQALRQGLDSHSSA